MRNDESILMMLNGGGGGGTDTDAQAFLDAAGITDGTISTAINNLVLSLKDEGIWDNMIVIYPFVGGTATTHKYNLKDPRDLDAAYRGVFFGSWTHDANGITGVNGASHIKTKYISGTNYNGALGSYVRNNVASVIAWGVQGGNKLYLNFSSLVFFGFGSSAVDTTANTDSSGFICGSKISSTNSFINKRGTIYTGSNMPDTMISNEVYLNDLNNYDTPFGIGTTANYAFAFISNSISQAESQTLKTIIQDFQTELNRQV